MTGTRYNGVNYNMSLDDLALRFAAMESHDYYNRNEVVYEGDYVIHVDGYLLWKGGFSRRMKWWERVLWRLGKLKTVRP